MGDGSHWIWDAAALEFAKRDEVLDVYHGLENISHCGKVLYGESTPEYETWREETTLELLWNGYELIEKRLDRLEKEGRKAGNRTKKNQGAKGRSIGNGQVEGACKNLIGRRLKQTGAKWRLRRVNNMATLCALFYGNQWNAYRNYAK